jgi:transposase
MANRLKMALVTTVYTLLDQGWSQRRIARELGIDRETIRRYARLRERSKPAGAPPGSPGPDPPGAEAPPGFQASACEPFREIILTKLDLGLTARRIHQELVTEHGFEARYHSVRRFVARLRRSHPLPFRRIETPPGEQAQVDFGTGAPVITPDGHRRRTHVFRVVLSYSRKAYSEVVYRQTTENFIRCLENAFHHFGGVPQTVVIDNLKAPVSKADRFDPELNPKIQSFCTHYGTTILPTKPRMPRHKGKVERMVGYV